MNFKHEFDINAVDKDRLTAGTETSKNESFKKPISLISDNGKCLNILFAGTKFCKI